MEKEWGDKEWDLVVKRLENLTFEEILEIAEEGNLNFYGKGNKQDYIYALNEISKNILSGKLSEIEQRKVTGGKVEMLVKIHQSHRKVVAICDAELLCKKFEQGNLQLEINEQFYGGDRKSEVEVIEIIKFEALEDASFNFVGKKAVNAAIKAGIISREGIKKIQGVPHALVLL